MADNYRVRVKKGDQEIEVESTSKQFVDAKLKELIPHTDIDSEKSKQSHTGQTKKRKPSKGSVSNDASTKQESEVVDIPGIVSYIKESEDFSSIEKHVLDKRDRLPRIMMCLYYAAQFKEGSHLTTGHIQSITNQFNIKIASSNASKNIVQNQKYITSKNTRKPGEIVYYKLTRNGEKRFQEIIKGKDA